MTTTFTRPQLDAILEALLSRTAGETDVDINVATYDRAAGKVANMLSANNVSSAAAVQDGEAAGDLLCAVLHASGVALKALATARYHASAGRARDAYSEAIGVLRDLVEQIEGRS